MLCLYKRFDKWYFDISGYGHEGSIEGIKQEELYNMIEELVVGLTSEERANLIALINKMEKM